MTYKEVLKKRAYGQQAAAYETLKRRLPYMESLPSGNIFNSTPREKSLNYIAHSLASAQAEHYPGIWKGLKYGYAFATSPYHNMKPTPRSFNSLYREAYGDFGPQWLKGFQQRVKNNKQRASQIYTPESLRAFSKYFNPNNLIDTYPAWGPTQAGYQTYSDMLMLPDKNFRNYWHYDEQAMGPNEQGQPQKGYVSDITYTGNDPGTVIPLLKQIYRNRPEAAQNIKQIKAHETNHALAAATHPSNKIRLNLKQDYQYQLPGIDPYATDTAEINQAAMSANQGRNYMIWKLKKEGPQAYPRMDFLTYNKLMSTPSYFDKNQLRDFHGTLKGNQQLFKDLPMEAKRFYKNYNNVQEGAAWQANKPENIIKDSLSSLGGGWYRNNIQPKTDFFHRPYRYALNQFQKHSLL